MEAPSVEPLRIDTEGTGICVLKLDYSHLISLKANTEDLEKVLGRRFEKVCMDVELLLLLAYDDGYGLGGDTAELLVGTERIVLETYGGPSPNEGHGFLKMEASSRSLCRSSPVRLFEPSCWLVDVEAGVGDLLCMMRVVSSNTDIVRFVAER